MTSELMTAYRRGFSLWWCVTAWPKWNEMDGPPLSGSLYCFKIYIQNEGKQSTSKTHLHTVQCYWGHTVQCQSESVLVWLRTESLIQLSSDPSL